MEAFLYQHLIALAAAAVAVLTYARAKGLLDEYHYLLGLALTAAGSAYLSFTQGDTWAGVLPSAICAAWMTARAWRHPDRPRRPLGPDGTHEAV